MQHKGNQTESKQHKPTLNQNKAEPNQNNRHPNRPYQTIKYNLRIQALNQNNIYWSDTNQPKATPNNARTYSKTTTTQHQNKINTNQNQAQAPGRKQPGLLTRPRRLLGTPLYQALHEALANEAQAPGNHAALGHLERHSALGLITCKSLGWTIGG